MKIDRSGRPGQHDYRVVVYQNRVRLALWILLALFFVGLGLYLLCSKQNWIAGSLLTLFFSPVLCYFGIRLVKPKKALILDNNGVTDTSSGIAVGFIAWDEIKETVFFEGGTRRADMLLIFLHDPRAATDRAGGRLLRIGLRFNSAMVKTPVAISRYGVAASLKDIQAEVDHMLSFRQQARR